MTKAHDNDNLPRLMGRHEAAKYLGIAESTFSLWVATHKMPHAIPGTRKWDRKAIDAKLDAISGLDVANDNIEDEFEKWERDRDARKTQRAGERQKTPRKR